MAETAPPKTLGSYRIDGKLGAGGMGTVYKAVQGTLERPVALKVLPPELARNHEYIARFLREARAAANLRHENVVQVYDAGEIEGQYFIAMELVDGHNLLQHAEKKHPIAEDECLKLFLQAARGLAAAHAKGLIHRDIKPENLLVGADGTLRVVDFGLVADETSTTQLTATGACLGTPMYMSPEQADGEQADARTDVYSLGVTFFRVFTGQPPFTSGTLVNLLYKHKFEAPPDPRTLRQDLSDNARNLLLRLMAKKRDDRPANGQAVAELIDGALNGKKIEPPPPSVLVALDKPTMNTSGSYEPAATLINPASQAHMKESAVEKPAAKKSRLIVLGTSAVVAVLLAVVLLRGGNSALKRAKTLVLQQREQDAIVELTNALKSSPGDESLQKTKSALINLQTLLSHFGDLQKNVQIAADRVRSVKSIDDDDRVSEFGETYSKLTARMLQRPTDIRQMFAEGGYEGVEKAAALLKADAGELHASLIAAAAMCDQKADKIKEKRGVGINLPWQRSGNLDKVDAMKAFAKEYRNQAEQVNLLKN